MSRVIQRSAYYGVLMFLHFATDFLCASTLFKSGVDNLTLSVCIIAYDVLAFVTQPLIGLLLEKYCNKRTLILPMALVLLGTMMPNIYIAVILLGLGNSLFHVIGGKMTIDTSEKQTPLGLFVAPGALGLALGTYMPTNRLLVGIIAGVVVVALVGIQMIPKPQKTVSEKEIPLSIMVLLAVVLAVMIRSFLGSYVKYELSLPYFVVLVGLASTLGKMIGGIISDYISPYVTIILASFGALIFMPFVDNVTMSLIGILLFNMAMPVTLWMSVKLFPRHQAFAFGLLAGLLCPSYFLGQALRGHYTVIVLIIILVANGAMLLYAQYRLKRELKC